ncbi:HD domain-containing protein [Clostridium sp. 19966]|uniref:HD domain-containing protein n=1 Tax=Clostridium sp. 19966 TaxID=2768166 RepID=UPI0028DE82CB|nr:HD domain-containing protein [Clostridium sp. 19966]MDT8716941.1 HD domain-containing protein [Clostridium sp. 19966]
MKDSKTLINSILLNQLYKECLYKNKRQEELREFCHHDLEHFLAVARIAYIINLERGMKLDKHIIYAAALLHDIGRWKQYQEGTPHELASAELSLEILKECEYGASEIHIIINAITSHREYHEGIENLSELIYYADKKSRNCFDCQASQNCNWSEAKKNHGIEY